MPKIVDHDARRAEVLDATWRVIAEKGVEGATVREIAKAAGVSNGVLAHYFSNKDDILIQAHRLAYDRVFQRVEIDDADPLDTLRRMLDEALPLDADRRVEALIDVSYMGRAITNAALSEVRRASAQTAMQWWRESLQRAADAGRLKDGIDVELAAADILVFIDGVSIQAILDPDVMTDSRQRALADALIARIAA